MKFKTSEALVKMKEMELELEKAVIEEEGKLKKIASELTSNPIYIRHKQLEVLGETAKQFFVESIDELIKK